LHEQLLKELKPDGVFTSVERLAFATYYACYDLKISVPEQLKVIGFSSLEIAPLLNPSLTTVTQPATKIGIEAAMLLFKMLEDPSSVNPNEKIVLNSKLIKRRSTEN
jgi:LacI family transcriptional regulator